MFSREYSDVHDDGSSDLPGFNMPFDKNAVLGSSGYNVLMEDYLNNGFNDYYDPEAQGKLIYYY